MLSVYVASVGIMGPGLTGWEHASKVLSGVEKFRLAELPKLKPKILPPAMLRRTTRHIRMAIEVAAETLANTGSDNIIFASVFTASENDAEITDEICRAVVSDEPFVSASSFNNSVSNAAVGTWSIALKSQQPSTCVTGYDVSFSVGLLEAATQVVAEERNVLLVSHDVIGNEPLWSLRPLLHDFGVGLMLTNKPTAQTLARLDIELSHDEAVETVMADEELEKLRGDNPAARSLPLLRLLAANSSGRVTLPYHDNSSIHLEVKNGATDP